MAPDLKALPSAQAGTVRRAPLLAGAVVVAFSMAGGRWGAYIGAPPIFLTDVLFVAAVTHFVVARVLSRAPRPSGRRSVEPRRSRLGIVLLALLLGWVMTRWLITPRLDLDALRDLAPFVYILLGLLSASAIRDASARARERTKNLLVGALTLHMLWDFVSTVVAPALPSRLPLMPGSSVRLLEVRPDVDTAMVGVLAGWLVVRLIRGRWSFLMLLLTAMSLVTIFSPGLRPSRAGVAGALLAIGIALVVSLRGLDKRRSMISVLVVGLAAIVVLAVLPNTTVYQRTLGTFGDTSSMVTADAAGTTRARTQTWQYLIDWVAQDDARRTIGVGFGPNFLADSRGAYLLIHRAGIADDDPRSPHNFWITAFARLGFVGVALFAGLCLALAWRSWQLRREAGDNELLLISMLVPAALLVPFTFGVILESPFGAIPFYWAAGVVFGWAAVSAGPARARRAPR